MERRCGRGDIESRHPLRQTRCTNALIEPLKWLTHAMQNQATNFETLQCHGVNGSNADVLQHPQSCARGTPPTSYHRDDVLLAPDVMRHLQRSLDHPGTRICEKDRVERRVRQAVQLLVRKAPLSYAWSYQKGGYSVTWPCTVLRLRRAFRSDETSSFFVLSQC
jgi:hypothetical protein